MASFAVNSLFTNIPLNEVIDLCTDVIFYNRDTFYYSNCKFDRCNFREFLGFAVRDNQFMLD